MRSIIDNNGIRWEVSLLGAAAFGARANFEKLPDKGPDTLCFTGPNG